MLLQDDGSVVLNGRVSVTATARDLLANSTTTTAAGRLR
jgi:hypothetical protein